MNWYKGFLNRVKYFCESPNDNGGNDIETRFIHEYIVQIILITVDACRTGKYVRNVHDVSCSKVINCNVLPSLQECCDNVT